MIGPSEEDSQDNAREAESRNERAEEQSRGIDRERDVPDDENDENDDDDDDDENTTALFVTSMPRNIWANPSLGAIAALIDETEEENVQAAQSRPLTEDQAAQATGVDTQESSNVQQTPEESYQGDTSVAGSTLTDSSARSVARFGNGKVSRSTRRDRRAERRTAPYEAERRRAGSHARDREASEVSTGEAQVMMSLMGL